MNGHKLLDTNVLVYAFDKSETQKHEKAKKIIEACLAQKERFYISTQNISEFYHVITRYVEKPVSKPEARRLCEKFIFFSGFVKISPTTHALLEAMEINAETGVGYWDALIAATMIENGITSIITENGKDFRKILGLVVSNPFA
jgi:predicted nucleic acid-binding protein